MLCLWLIRRETISANVQRVRGAEQKLIAANGYYSGRHFWRTVRNLSWFSSNRGNVYGKERTWSETGAARRVRGISAAWKSRVLPAGDDRQEEASKRAECLVYPIAGNPTRMMIYPLVSCGRSLKTVVPWVKRCNRLPLFKSGANLSALSSERVRSNAGIAGAGSSRRIRWFSRLTRSIPSSKSMNARGQRHNGS